MKRPSFQFYPGDWQGNAKLRRCTHAERGIWLDIMCLMHDAEEYGVLRWPLSDIAQAVGCKVAHLKAIARKGVLKGCDSGKMLAFIFTPRHAGQDGDPVTLLPEQEGPVWFSSRMVRDEYTRQKRGESSRFGGTPNPTPKAAPMPPFGVGNGRDKGDGSSSSSSSSRTTPPNPPKASEAFSHFWDAYPRKVAKPAAQKAWGRIQHADGLLPVMLAAIAAQKQSEQWRKEAGAFIPHPATWLNQRRWEDEQDLSMSDAPSVPADGRCACGELGVLRAKNGEWRCRQHQEVA